MTQMTEEEVKVNFQRLCDRYNFDLVGEIAYTQHLSTNITIVELSKTGFKAKKFCNVPNGAVMLRARNHLDESMELHCEKVWEGNGFVGFRICFPSEKWESFIQHIASFTEPNPINL